MTNRVQSENQRMSMRNLEVLSSIDPITTTSTGDSECMWECESECVKRDGRGAVFAIPAI